eukprot:c27095_g1_i1 orf=388-1500(-)
MVFEQSEDTGQGSSKWEIIPARNAGFKVERVEKVAKKLFVGAGARVLFYPTLFYNVVRNKLEAEFRWWDQIDQFLFLGAVPFRKDVLRLKGLGVEAVVTLNESYETLVPTSVYQSQGIKQLVIPTQDYLFAPSFTDIQLAVNFIHENAQQRKATYVHCKAGRGRSTTIVLCYLVEHRGMTPCDAFQYVQSKRPRVLLAAAQWEAVLEYSERRHQFYVPSSGEIYIPEQWPASVCLAASDNRHVETPTLEDGSSCSEDLPIVVTSSDLDGYRGIKDAGLIGNTLFKELGVAYRVRFMAARNVIGVVRASAALAKLSCLRLGCHSGNARTTLKCSSSLDGSSHTTTSFNPSLSSQIAVGLNVPVCKQGMVEC